MDQLDFLLSLEAIKQLKARYFRCIDEKRWTELRNLFVDDATVSYPGLGGFTDADACVASLSKALEIVRTVHHGHMPEIEFRSHTLATGIWAMQDVVKIPPGGEDLIPGYPPEFRHGFVGYGHYHETYMKIDTVWKISSLELRRLLLRPLNDAG